MLPPLDDCIFFNFQISDQLFTYKTNKSDVVFIMRYVRCKSTRKCNEIYEIYIRESAVTCNKYDAINKANKQFITQSE